MSVSSTGKTAEVMVEKFKETYEHQQQMIELTDFHEPEGGMMQDSSNVIWYPVQQHAPILSGWDLSSAETGIIEETYPAVLGTPNNDFVQQRADQMRTQRYWERRGEQSGKRQATELNSDIASAVATQGSLFYRSNVTSGYEFIAEAQAIMNERQAVEFLESADTNHCPEGLSESAWFPSSCRRRLRWSVSLHDREAVATTRKDRPNPSGGPGFWHPQTKSCSASSFRLCVLPAE